MKANTAELKKAMIGWRDSYEPKAMPARIGNSQFYHDDLRFFRLNFVHMTQLRLETECTE